MKKRDKVDILVRNVSADDHRRLRKKCEENCTDMSKILRRAIREYVER